MTPPVLVLIATVSMMVVIWLFSVWLRNASIVDVFWGSGFVVGAWLYFALTDTATPRKWLVVALVAVWGLRLTTHLFVRNHGKGEDYRYRAMRDQHGPRFWWISFWTVYLLQGLIMWVVGLPVWVAMRSAEPSDLTLIDGLGLAVFLAGLFFETVGDWQLTRFKANPANKGKLLTTGLWRYTRHPNYFGDALVWWGLTLFALATPGSVWVVISPVMMTFLLMRVSGVALLEKRLCESKPEFRDYVQRTNAFLPWFPRG